MWHVLERPLPTALPPFLTSRRARRDILDSVCFRPAPCFCALAPPSLSSRPSLSSSKCSMLVLNARARSEARAELSEAVLEACAAGTLSALICSLHALNPAARPTRYCGGQHLHRRSLMHRLIHARLYRPLAVILMQRHAREVTWQVPAPSWMAICRISTLLLPADDNNGEAATFATSATLCAPASKKCRAAHPRMNVAPGSHHRCYVWS